MDHIEALFSMATPEELALGSSAPSTRYNTIII